VVKPASVTKDTAETGKTPKETAGRTARPAVDPHATVKTPTRRDSPAQPPRDTDTIALVRPNLSKTKRTPTGTDRAPAEPPDRKAAEEPRTRTEPPGRPAASAASAASAAAASRTARPEPAASYDRVPTPGAGGAAATRQFDRGNERFETVQPPAGPAAPTPARGRPAAPQGTGRRARLRLARVEPLSVTRMAFAFSLCVFVILLVAIIVLWFVLNSIGVFDSVTEAAETLTDGSDTNIAGWLSFGRAIQISLLVGAINVVLMTALATLGALLYNLCADMIGGLEVTLSDE